MRPTYLLLIMLVVCVCVCVCVEGREGSLTPRVTKQYLRLESPKVAKLKCIFQSNVFKHKITWTSKVCGQMLTVLMMVYFSKNYKCNLKKTHPNFIHFKQINLILSVWSWGSFVHQSVLYLKWLRETFKCLWNSLMIPLMIINFL